MSYESTIQQSGHLMTFGDSCTNLTIVPVAVRSLQFSQNSSILELMEKENMKLDHRTYELAWLCNSNSSRFILVFQLHRASVPNPDVESQTRTAVRNMDIIYIYIYDNIIIYIIYIYIYYYDLL